MTNARKGAADTISEGDVEKRGLIAVVEIARNFRARPQTIHKIVNRLGIDTVKVTSEGTRGRKASHVTEDGYREIEKFMAQPGRESVSRDDSYGVFYLVLLEPEQDPGRFEVGFTSDLNGR